MGLKESKAVRSRYNRYSYVYDLFEGVAERLLFRRWRSDAITDIRGKILEVGMGTGKNLPFYHEGCDLVGIDISEKMLKRGVRRGKKNIKAEKVSLLQGDGQNLCFKDSMFDVIVTSFVLCSIPDPVAALIEMKRVLKDGGKMILLEHVKSQNLMIRLFQDLFNPLTCTLMGFNVNRDTKTNIKHGGLNIIEDRRLAFRDVFRLFRVGR